MKTILPRVLARLLVLIGSGFIGLAPAVAADGNGAIEVPFEFLHGAILVQTKIGESGPYTMMLDTGVDLSIVDLPVAKAAGLKVSSEGAQGTGGGQGSNLAYETAFPSLHVGALTAQNVPTLAADLAQTSKALGKPVHGVLGYSLLQHRVVRIDYPKRVVRFYASSPYGAAARPNGARFTVLKFQYRDDVLVEGIGVNGKAVTANLDTGSSSTFQLTPSAVAALGLEAQASQGRASSSVGINGQISNREGKVDAITVGGIRVEKPDVVFYGKGMGYDEMAWGVRIGNGFLKDYVVTIDYQNSTIVLERP